MKRFLSVLILLCSLAALGQAQDQANLFRPTATPSAPPCPFSRLFMNMSNQLALVDCNGVVTLVGGVGGGSGTVTSVGLSLPGIFSVSGSPVTTSGTLTAALANQTANRVFSGPTTGSAAAPTFRALVAADIPNLDAAKITTGTIATARLGSGTASSTTVLLGNQTWGSVPFPSGVMEAINAKRDYGCVGDDSTNDTTCLTNALTAAALTTGKTLYLPSGIYRTNAKISVPGGVKLVGDGWDKSIIHGTGNDVIVDAVVGTGIFAFKGPTIQHIGIRGSSSGANQIGLRVEDATYFAHVDIQNVAITDTGSHGMFVGKAFSSTFKRITSGNSLTGYPFVFDGINMPANHFEELYPGDVNSTSPAGFRIRSGNIHCISCNGINNSSSNSWWAIVGDKTGTDGAVSNRSAYFSCHNCNIESSKAGGILHYYNSTSEITGRSEFTGDGGSSGTYIALKYEIDTGGGLIPATFPKGNLGPLVVFTNSPLSYYANSEVIHANDLPPVTVESDVRQADGTIITSYRNTANSRSEKLLRLDARKPVVTITTNTSYTQPAGTNFEANCALGCTLTLPSATLFNSREEFHYIRNIGVGTLVVAANSGTTINNGGSYSLASGESAVFIPHSASGDYRLVGVGGSGVANRVTYWNDVQRLTSSANLTYDGTTFLNQKAGGNPYFAANDTTNGITTRFGPLAGAPDRAIIGTTSIHPFGLWANNLERWTIGTAGHLTPGAATTYNIGSASLPINDVTIGGSLYWTGTTVRDLSGSGSPEGVVTAGIGSVYRRTNGSTGTTLYVKEAGTGNTGWSAVGGGGGSGLTNLNGLTAGTQSFAVGTTGTDFAVSSATSTHTFNLPDAGASARGVVTTGTQTIAGAKTVTSVFTANPGTTPTTGILVDINALGTTGQRDSNWQVFRGRSFASSTTYLAEWKLFADMTSDTGASKFALQTRINAASFGEVFSVDDAGLVSAGDFQGDTFTAAVGFVGDGSGLTALDASQLATGTVAANRGGAGSNNGILQANGSGTVGTVTVGTGLTYSGTTLTVNQAFSPTWTASHTFTGTDIVLGGGASALNLKFMEPSGSGANFTILKAQAQAGDITYTLPAADGSSGEFLKTNGSGSLSWDTPSSSPALTSTYVGYGNGSNTLTGTSDFIYSTSTKTLSVINGSGSANLVLNGSSDTSKVSFGASSVPGNQGGVVFPFVGGGNSSGPGIWWASSASYASMSGLYIDNGLTFQGANSTHDPFKVAEATGTSSNGTVRYTFAPSSSLFTQNLSTGVTTSTHDGMQTDLLSSGGAGGTNFGIGWLMRLENSASSLANAGRIRTTWASATSTAETSRIELQTNSAGGGLATSFTVEADQNYAVVNGLGSKTGSFTIDFNNGNYVTATATGNWTTVTFANIKAGTTYRLKITQDGTGGRTWTPPTTFKYPGGVSGNILTGTAGAVDVFTCETFDGTSLWCNGLFDVKNP